MRFNSQVNLIKFDLKAYRRELDAVMTEATREAARKWLDVVLRIIPTWSRASRATFNELAEAVGYNLTFGPIRSKQDRLTLGLRTGRGGLSIKPGTSWHFFYQTSLDYLVFNESNRAVFGRGGVFSRTGLINPTPYKFQDAGAAEFMSFAGQVLLPNPIDFVRGKRI